MICARKKMKRRSFFRLLIALALLPGYAQSDEQEVLTPEVLTIVTWGGAYEASQQAAYFEPFTAETGIEIQTVRYDGDVKTLRDHLETGSVEWDVIDMIRADASTACKNGLLEAIDPGILAPAPDGTPARQDFFDGAINRCDIIQLVFSTVIAYDDRAFPGVKPRTVEDFFNLERFPGKRALRKAPVGMLEWALLSYSVPRQQIYDLLSTERGFNLAFRRLDSIRDAIVWWRGGDEPVELLKSGKVAMASGYNGRFFNAQAIEGEPISVIWDGQLLDYNSWAIPKGTEQRETAERFIRFATRTENMATQANLISYGPARQSAQLRVGLHTKTGVPMRPHLPTAPAHLDTAITRDHQWYTQTQTLRQKRFQAWLQKHTDGDTQP
jgi:putative spermidine/putrescine transport system substrate-binding protein